MKSDKLPVEYENRTRKKDNLEFCVHFFWNYFHTPFLDKHRDCKIFE